MPTKEPSISNSAELQSTSRSSVVPCQDKPGNGRSGPRAAAEFAALSIYCIASAVVSIALRFIERKNKRPSTTATSAENNPGTLWPSFRSKFVGVPLFISSFGASGQFCSQIDHRLLDRVITSN